MATLTELLTAAAFRTAHTEDEIAALVAAFEAADGATVEAALEAMRARFQEAPLRSTEVRLAFQTLNQRLTTVAAFIDAMARCHQARINTKPWAERPAERPTERPAERPLHPDLVHAIEQLDAALFNGDAFDGPIAHAHMRRMLARWIRQLGKTPPQVAPDDGDVPT